MTVERFGRLGQAGSRIVLAGVPLLVIPLLIVQLHSAGTFAYDFHDVYWPAAIRVSHGQSPYALPMFDALKYPAVGAILFVPFAALPHALADWAFTLIALACVPAIIAVLGVRDWRPVAVAVLWQPVVYGWETANITLLLVLGVALLWRWRDDPRAAGTVLAVLVSVKLFLVPLVIWLLASRRYRAVAWTLVVAVGLNLAAWSLIGVSQFGVYVRLLHAFTAQAQWWGYGLITFMLHMGTGQTLAYAAGFGVAGGLFALTVRAARRADDRAALAAALVATLAISPIVETHYLSLLLVPLCLARPRLSLAWFLPLLLFACPADHPADWQRVFTFAVVAVLLLAIRQPPQASTTTQFAPPSSRSPSAWWRGRRAAPGIASAP